MNTEIIKASGYIRVSTKGQVEDESLSTQRESITRFAKQQGYKLTKIYADEGISGGSVEERHALLECLHDGQEGKFNVLIIHRLSRFGRNARELLHNHDQLKKAGVELRSISEGIDFGNKYGKAMLGMFAVMAELEKDIIRETMLENRIARGRRGIPTSGKLPYGPTFDKKTGMWKLNDDLAKKLQWAAEEYLNNGSLYDICKSFPMSYANLVRTLTQCCSDTWTVSFQGEEPITYKVPRILSDDTIQRIKDRLEFNSTCNRTDVKNKYLLTGFIRCEHCRNTLGGQTQIHNGVEYKYYSHARGIQYKCKAFSQIPLEAIERAVFKIIFENFCDVPSFEKAIAESMPDENMITDLKMKIKSGEKELIKIDRNLRKLVEIALAGTLKKETIRGKEQELLEEKANIVK